jgi:hypothetical protein
MAFFFDPRRKASDRKHIETLVGNVSIRGKRRHCHAVTKAIEVPPPNTIEIKSPYPDLALDPAVNGTAETPSRTSA